ncbi:MAG: DUF1588 domain-containing protein [Defluviicoccus sp.]|nr:DUF1588 domain-containing protein [Defluviicoccus sp.]MDE0278564.1 DUF1588 domain-containing protein [Defluviicoccus sp.]
MRRVLRSCGLLAVPLVLAAVVGLAVPLSGGSAVDSVRSTISVPLFVQSTATGIRSFLRVVNRSRASGTVDILAYDDSGLPHGPVTLALGAGDAVHLDADDLEAGDPEKGLPVGIGTGSGAWRLELSSALDIEVLSYVRTQDGLVGGMLDMVSLTGSGYRVALFEPAGTVGRVSRLRLVNPGSLPAAVTIEGIDDGGLSPGGAVRLSLPARASRTVTAEELESGDGEGLSGALGDGQGRWRLLVTADRRIAVMNLLFSSSTGAVSNLSADPVAAFDGDDGATTVHEVGLFPSASNLKAEGAVRIVNRTRQAGHVSIEAIDDTGALFGPVSLWVGPRESLVIGSGDLERGNAGKGLSVGTGSGTGDWRLRLSTALDMAVMSYVRPLLMQDGLLAAMGALVPRVASAHRLTLLDPSAMPGQEARLRLINPSASEAAISIRGMDGTGAVPGGAVRMSLAAGASLVVAVTDLEDGAGPGLAGTLGDGTGRWDLALTSNRRIRVMSLLSGPGGYLANLSGAAGAAAEALAGIPEEPADSATAAEVFAGHISGPVVQSRCINCHVAGGVSAHTRLVFERAANPDHEALNLATFERFMTLVDGAASRILNKIQGVAHGGGEQVPADSAEFAWMERFLDRLGGPPALFARHVSEPVVQSRCIVCHVEGGRSGHTRLVFERATNSDHEALNLATFERFLSEVEGGASRILNKIQGVAHGGGEQVQADSAEFAWMERFLGGLDAGVVPAPITVDTLFDPVRMAPLAKTLRRAALIFAGRAPTQAEYDAVYGGATALRKTIRDLMTGPGFHDFLIRGANDRLLTDRQTGQVIDPNSGFFVDFVDQNYVQKKAGVETNSLRPYYTWLGKVHHGVRRAPLELIAYVVENDLPYTEILTADYIMANPHAAMAYGATTSFDDPDNPREFKRSRIAKYYRHGEGYMVERDRVVDADRLIAPGPLSTRYPHSGVLGTNAFLYRYPTTPTNRNRARARWTYYHFLGLDVEKSASRTTDPVALADTNNPTMHNPACTVCHSVLDPVAGAFQDYGDEGYYKDQWGGMDSLHRFYKEDDGAELSVEAQSWRNRETLTWPLILSAGTAKVKVTFSNQFWDEAAQETSHMYLDRFDLFDATGRRVTGVEFEDLEPPVAPWGECGGARRNPATGRKDYFLLWAGHDTCAMRFDVRVPETGIYTAEVVAWSQGYDKRFEGDGYAKLAVIANGYQEGDTWYRDMRVPGFNGERAPEGEDSLQWLARQIVDDRRFAEATVKFWWPAIMGSEIAEAPEAEDDADFDGLLLAANAQSAEMRRLAHGFREGFIGGRTYNLKDLLVEIVLSKWFRADAFDDADPVRLVALRHAGARRLLTPEELAQKTAALTGFQWGRHIDVGCGGDCDARPNDLTGEFRLLYGGIDSDGITERARNITSVMAGVAKRHAVRTSCPVVMREFYLLPDEDRRLFEGLDKDVTPALQFDASFEIAAEENWETVSLERSLSEGSTTVRLSFINDHYGGPDQDRNLRLDRMSLKDTSGRLVASYELETLDPISECNHPVDDHFGLHCRGSVDVPIEVPSAGTYRLEIVARADRGGDELALLEVEVLDPTFTGGGATSIREKLVELHETLLGAEVTPHSPDVDAAFNLFVDVMERGRNSDDLYFHAWQCDWRSDIHFMDGILDDPIVKKRNEWGPYYDFDWPRVNALLENIDFSDDHYSAHAWVVVLAYLLTDYRYLYL